MKAGFVLIRTRNKEEEDDALYLEAAVILSTLTHILTRNVFIRSKTKSIKGHVASMKDTKAEIKYKFSLFVSESS